MPTLLNPLARTIRDAIAHRAAARANEPALIGFPFHYITFAELHSSIARIGRDLANAGLAREDRVGLLVPPGMAGGELIVALASSIALVPMNPGLTVPEIEEACRTSGLAAIVIPRWLQTPARATLLEQPITTLEADRAPDGALSLEILSRVASRPSAQLRPAEAAGAALLLRSSGTVGAPKLIPVTHGNLLAMADRLSSDLWFSLTADDRAVATLPLYYAAGLKTTLLVPLLLGASVAFPSEGRELDIAAWGPALKPTYLSVSPASLNRIVDRLKASARSLDDVPLRFVMCGAAYLPQELRVAAQSILRAPVLEFYGLSEAGVMAANPAAPGRIKPGTVGVPVREELKLVDEDGKTVTAGAVGEIMVRGPTVTPGYVTDGDSVPRERKEAWLSTGDLGRLDDDGYLTIVGRTKEVINRGGEKVFPYEIEKALLEHPAVLEAAAFGVPHPRQGESVAAAVALKSGRAVSGDELKTFLAGRLAAFKHPRRLWLVPSLPRGNTGKLVRRALGEAYAVPRDRAVPPGQLLEVELHDLWKRLLATDDIGIDDDFLEKGGDSLLATEMLLAAEELVGKPYPQSELSILTIRRMAQVFNASLAADRERPTQVRDGGGIPLFFCHGDYLTRGIYASRLAALLPDDQAVFLLHPPENCAIPSSMEDIAQSHLQEVLRAAPNSPVFVAGYCNGGLAAWHLTHLLRLKGIDVVELLLIETLSLNARRGLRALASVFRAAGAIPGRAAGVLKEDGMRAVWIKRRGFASVTTLLGAARNRIFPGNNRQHAWPQRDSCDVVSRAYLQLMSRYVPPRIDVPVTCFTAEEGCHFDTNPRFWRRLAGEVREVGIPGAHLSAPVSEREALAVALADTLQRATSRHMPQTL